MLRMLKLAPPHLADLYRELADVESGNARQWLFLELAQQLDPVPYELSRPRRPWQIRLAGGLLAWLGPAALTPLLRSMGVAATGLYQHSLPMRIAVRKRGLQSLREGCLVTLCIVFGFTGARADTQWITVIGDATLLIGWAGIWVTDRFLRPPPPELLYAEAGHCGAEEVSGLLALLIANGMEPAQAQASYVELLNNPDHALKRSEDLQALLRYRPGAAQLFAGWKRGLCWATGCALPLLPYWVASGPWLCAISLALGGSTLYGSARMATGDAQAGLRALLAGLIATGVILACGIGLHYLLQ